MREKLPLSDKFARRAEPGIYFDHHRQSPPGFMLRVTPAGARSWCLNYRVKDTGRERRITLGTVGPAWPIAEARKHAAELRREVDAGGDPLGERERKRQAPTVAELWDRFVSEELPHRAASTQAEYRAMTRDWILPALGRLKVAAVGREDVQKLHRRITEAGKKRRANSVKSLCSTLFSQAIVWEMRGDNPAEHVKTHTEHRRERYLEPDEIARLITEVERHRALGGHWIDSADKIELAMLTGARRGEILGMTWSQLQNLDGETTWVLASQWTKEGKRTGQSKRLPLSPDAVAVLRRRRDQDHARHRVVRLRDDYVFRAGNTKTGANELEGDWYIIRASAGLQNLRFHDLRHNFASIAIGQGLSLEIIGKLLGHSKAQTTERYAHLRDTVLRDATEKVGAIVRGRTP